MVRRGSEPSLEAPLSDHSNKSKDRNLTIGPPGIGGDTKSMVEVSHRPTTNHRKKNRGIEQIKEAFGNTPLGRIRLVNARKEDD